VFGHAFSPFLRFRGGKGIAATFGVWSALTLWQGPCLLGALFLLGKFALRLRDAWTVMLGMAGLAVLGAAQRDGVMVALGLANWGLLALTHRRELARR
jgi:glycerol-3-phosphate acyltransferase PlsY